MFQPTKVRLRGCNIAGANMRLHTKGITVYESMCKPYITSKLTIIDNNNVINSLGLRGGEKISFAFDGGGRIYESEQYILTVEGQTSEENLRAQVYTITAATESYFKDRANLVQKSFVNIPATGAVQQIHDAFLGGDAPLRVLSQSLGLIAQDKIGSHIVSNVKPFKAIEDIIGKASYGAFKTGSTVYFRNRDEYVIGPLEQIFAEASPIEEFIQSNTWGSDWRHIFTATHAIIAASTVNEEGKGGKGTGSAMNLSSTMNQAQSIFDFGEMKLVKETMGSAISAGGVFGSPNLPSAVTGFAKKLGGSINVNLMNSNRNPLSSDSSLQAMQEKLFKAVVKDGVNYYIKVPIQSGINVTVGKGINAKLIPPLGDQSKGKSNVGGQMLVADCMHECWFDDRLVQATTTMRAVKGGYNN